LASNPVAIETIATVACAGVKARLALSHVGSAQVAAVWARQTRGATGELASERVCARSTRLDVGLAGATARISAAFTVVARRTIGEKVFEEEALTAGW
jgi:hypothetical protein